MVSLRSDDSLALKRIPERIIRNHQPGAFKIEVASVRILSGIEKNVLPDIREKSSYLQNADLFVHMAISAAIDKRK